MSLTVDAVFDGKVFRPSSPIPLQPNTHVRIEVISDEEPAVSFLEVAQSLALSGPPDWSAKLDEYLYGRQPANEA